MQASHALHKIALPDGMAYARGGSGRRILLGQEDNETCH